MSTGHASTFAAELLRRQAQRLPQAPALRTKRRGSWHELAWADVARQAADAARGWAAVGLGHGGALAALGPLSPAFIASLYAALDLGATVDVAAPGAEDRLLADARFVLADGGHDLDRVLRDAGTVLTLVVVADGTALAGVVPPRGVRLMAFDELLALGARGSSDAPSDAPVAAARVIAADGGRTELQAPHGVPGAAAAAPARALADFGTDWMPGLAWLLGEWPASGTTLVLPEPGGDELADRREAQADAWLAPQARLTALAEQLQQRIPARGLGAYAARSALAGANHPLAQHARWRIRAELGVQHTRSVYSDLAADAAVRPLLQGLCISAPAASDRDAVADAGPSALALAGSTT